MAYAAAVTWQKVRYPAHTGGVEYTIIRVVETDAGTNSEWDTIGSNTGVTVTSAANGKSEAVPLPQLGTICLVEAKLADAGSGADIQPSFTKTDNADADSVNLIAVAGAASDFVHEQSPARFVFAPGIAPAGRVIFGKSNVDAGSDNPIETLIVIAEGMMV